MLTRMALASTGPQRALADPLLRRCGQVAWSCNDTELMAWVLEQAAARGLPLSAFAPMNYSSSLLSQSEPASAGTPPAFIRALLGRGEDSLTVAFVQTHTHAEWIANDGFDQQVCSRQKLHEARSLPPCDVSALFSPAEEIKPFERDVYAALFAALAPVHGSESSAGISMTERNAEEEDMAGLEALQSEIVDLTSMWRLRLRANDVYVCCKVVFRCMVLRGGAEIWVAGCYMPQSQRDASRTSKKVLCGTSRARGHGMSQQRRAKRTESPDAVDEGAAHAGMGLVLDAHSYMEPLDAHPLLEQLQAASTDEMLRMLEEDPYQGIRG